MKILLVNAYNDDNKGSAALTIAALHRLHEAFDRPELSIVPLSQTLDERTPQAHFRHSLRQFPETVVLPPLYPKEGLTPSARSVGVASVTRSDRDLNPTTLEAIRRADLVVSRGGVILHCREGGIGGTASFLNRTLPLNRAVHSGIPTVIFGAQIGPFQSAVAKREMGRILAKSALVLPRDQVSLAAVLQLAPDIRPHLMPDSVFALASGRPKDRSVNDSKCVGAVVSAHVTGDENKACTEMAQRVAAAAQAANADKVVLFVHVAGAGSGDLPATERVAELVSKMTKVPVHVHEDTDISPSGLIREYARCSLVVSSRLHAVILALVAGTPAISVPTGVTFKERAVLGNVGLAQLAPQSRTEFDLVLKLITADMPTWAARIEANVEMARERIQSIDRILSLAAG